MAAGLFRFRAFFFLTLLGGCFVLHSKAEKPEEEKFFTNIEEFKKTSEEFFEGKSGEELQKRSDLEALEKHLEGALRSGDESLQVRSNEEMLDDALARKDTVAEDNEHLGRSFSGRMFGQENQEAAGVMQEHGGPGPMNIPSALKSQYGAQNMGPYPHPQQQQSPLVSDNVNISIVLPQGNDRVVPMPEKHEPRPWFYPITSAVSGVGRWICGLFSEC